MKRPESATLTQAEPRRRALPVPSEAAEVLVDRPADDERGSNRTERTRVIDLRDGVGMPMSDNYIG